MRSLEHSTQPTDPGLLSLFPQTYAHPCSHVTFQPSLHRLGGFVIMSPLVLSPRSQGKRRPGVSLPCHSGAMESASQVCEFLPGDVPKAVAGLISSHIWTLTPSVLEGRGPLYTIGSTPCLCLDVSGSLDVPPNHYTSSAAP
jgi:hypothetical protein